MWEAEAVPGAEVSTAVEEEVVALLEVASDVDDVVEAVEDAVEEAVEEVLVDEASVQLPAA